MGKIKASTVITAIPLILVNIVAVSGQYAFLREHLSWPVYGAAIFAAALESTALYLAYMAHQSLMNLDSSMRLRLGAITFGLLAGIMNASHYRSHGHLTFVSIATGIMSASSPVLWGIYSRRQSRDKLMQLGLIEPGAVKLGINRWIMYPIKSFRVYRNAAWAGERNPQIAISEYEAMQDTESEPMPEPQLSMQVTTPALQSALASDASKADAVRYALRALTADSNGAVPKPADVAGYLAGHGHAVSAQYVRDVARRDREAQTRDRRAGMRAISAASPSD
jgi:hypothetical protein